MAKKWKKWKSFEVDMWNESWTMVENGARNDIAYFCKERFLEGLWEYHVGILWTPLDFLEDNFFAIGRASLPKKEKK